MVKIYKSLPKNGRSPNIVFAKGGVEYIIERPYAFSRKKPFRFYFFVNLKKRKWFLLGSGLVGISVFLIPAFAKPFPVSCNPI